MKDKDKIHTALGVLGGGTQAVFGAAPLHLLRTFRFLQQWRGCCINMLHYSAPPPPKASCAYSGAGVKRWRVWASGAVRWGWKSWVELPYKDWNTTQDQGNFLLWLLPAGPFTNTS